MLESPQEPNTSEMSTAIAEVSPHVLKHGDSFAIIDRRGNIRPLGLRDHGLFRDGTRFLSRLLLKIGGQLPVILHSELSAEADMLSVNFTNPQLETVSDHDTLHVRQQMILWENTLYTRITIHNYGLEVANFPLSIEFDADYVDIFEVRGLNRTERGTTHPSQHDAAYVHLAYTGLDKVERQTHLKFSPQPANLDSGSAVFTVALEPNQETELTMTVSARYPEEAESTANFEDILAQLRAKHDDQSANVCRIESSHERFTGWMDASRRDLLLLLTETENGLYPYAGVPWFSTVFGRDGIITALQTLWFYPEVARGVLATLAAKQAETEDLTRESEPGKILHEERRGEMANTGEIPFGSYYGTVDATPLFVVLAGRYYQRTGDRAFIEQLWLSIEAALHWIDNYGDIDGDGFVEYRRKNENGILQQGWKDSNDSVFYEDGKLVDPPVALCEVQGYVYEAKSLTAEMAEALGRPEMAQMLRGQAEDLREKFQQAFWLEDLGTYAIALDGEKRPCRVRTSNPGHCLYSGIADPQHAQRITEQLLSPDYFSGWGIRTLAVGEPRYNPMAYHDGTVWPHDNSLIVSGMARYGFKEAAAQVLKGLFDTSTFVDMYRLPELFCGFERCEGQGPTLYPVACLPQAWAAGSVFLMLEACLGIRVDGARQQIILDHPTLPLDTDVLHIHNLPVGNKRIDLILKWTNDGVEVAPHSNDVEVIIH